MIRKIKEDTEDRPKNFTLGEGIAAILILVVFVGAIYFAITGVSDETEEKACEIQVETVRAAVEGYRLIDDDDDYPTDIKQIYTGKKPTLLYNPNKDSNNYTIHIKSDGSGEVYTTPACEELSDKA